MYPGRRTAAIVLLAASLYQLVLKDFIFVSMGVRRHLQPLEAFPYSCRRVQHERLEACEDLWLDDEKRVLYAACTGSMHRRAWSMAMGAFNTSGRRPGGSDIIALNIDEPGDDGLFGMRSIKPLGYVGATGNQDLDLVGFDATVLDSNTLRFYLVNHRPPINEHGGFIDAKKVGANATIEIFDLKRGANEMTHVKTIFSPAVFTPNRVAILDNGDFVVTNDHSTKTGLRRELDPFIGGGSVAYCSLSGACHIATPKTTFNFPNGLAKGKDGLIYVPNSMTGFIHVMEVTSDKMLRLVDIIKTGYPLDNIYVDPNGEMLAAAFPRMYEANPAIENPFEETSASSIFKIRKTAGGYSSEIILEDEKKRVLSGATTAVRDVKSGTIFVGSAFSPFIMVCDPK